MGRTRTQTRGGATLPPAAARDWTVNVEAAGSADNPPLERAQLRPLLDRLAPHRPSVGCSSFRYSARFTVAGAGAEEALAQALAIWRDAVAETDLPEWPVIRCELAVKPL
jgi:hypothetical protein